MLTGAMLYIILGLVSWIIFMTRDMVDATNKECFIVISFWLIFWPIVLVLYFKGFEDNSEDDEDNEDEDLF